VDSLIGGLVSEGLIRIGELRLQQITCLLIGPLWAASGVAVL